MKNFDYKDIEIDLTGNLLSISNSGIKRTLDVSSGIPRTIFLSGQGGHELASDDKTEGDFSFIGINFPTSQYPQKFSIIDIDAVHSETSLFDGDCAKVSITTENKAQDIKILREYFIYPELPLIASQVSIMTSVMPNIFWTQRGNLFKNKNRNTSTPVSQLESCVDSLKLNGLKPAYAIEFFGRTDYTNTLVVKNDISGNNVNGNLLFCEGDKHGLFILQEAPPSSERRDFEEYDFRFENNTVYSCGWGIHPSETKPGKWFRSYRNVIGLYSDEYGKKTLLKKYQKIRFPQKLPNYNSVMVNPWGYEKFRSELNEEFLTREITAAAKLGATHYQIDDGWQKGDGLAELTAYNKALNREFWSFSEKLPNGFDNLAATAKKAGIELALWLAPSCNMEYRDCNEFTEIIMNFYRRYGIKVFKIDAMKIRTYEAERNIEKLLRSVREQSDGEIIFNLDVTNGQRSGYFMFLEYGSIFLENRYVHTGLGYHPENTLRNLWDMAEYARPQNLQIEIPFPGSINPDFYERKKIPLPDLYPLEYWAAIPMFANPLLWFAPSTIDKESASHYKKIMDIHLRWRREIFNGEIFPVGDRPDGRSFCGFQSHDFENKSGFLIIFRELASVNGKAIINLDFLPENIRWEKIYGNAADIEQYERNTVAIKINNAPDFAIFKYTHN